MVHEARLRGLNITSHPYSSDPNSPSYLIANDSALPWINKKGNKPKVTKIESTANQDLYLKLNKFTKMSGRYHIGINIDENRGHIITAERLKNGEIIYYDPQSGEFLNIKEYSTIQSYEVLRVDNLLFNLEILKCICRPL